MEILREIGEVRHRVSAYKRQAKRIGFVPTMGALHKGHLSLVEKARQHSDIIIVSIFVNPTQFGPSEDLERYPKPFDEDVKLCEENKVDILFYPNASDIYPGPIFIHFEIDQMADHLCGKSRQGHFQGVVQIVNKLFNIVQPDVAVFGLKDIQQFRILERMVEEFNHPVAIHGGTTVREPDGLAISSRNLYLKTEDRAKASQLYGSLKALENALHEKQNVHEKLTEERSRLNQLGAKVDYLQVVDYNMLQPISSHGLLPEKVVIAGAVFLGASRLIDNLIVEVSQG